VGIAGQQTGVYPIETPGGWQLIGRTASVMFDAERDPASLLAPGDTVRFVPL
jgi:allophanate hydrolase subunit 1